MILTMLAVSFAKKNSTENQETDFTTTFHLDVSKISEKKQTSFG